MVKKLRNKTALSDREYLYWITKQSCRKFAWIFTERFEQIIRHPDRKITLGQGASGCGDFEMKILDVKHICCFYLNLERLLTMFTDGKLYYVVKNVNEQVAPDESAKGADGDAEQVAENETDQVAEGETDEMLTLTNEDQCTEGETDQVAGEDESTRSDRARGAPPTIGGSDRPPTPEFNLETKPATSEIYITTSLDEAVGYFSSNERKLLKLEKRNKIKLSKIQIAELKNVVCVDFISQNMEEKINLWRRFILQQKEQINLIGFNFLTPNIVEHTPMNAKVEHVILYQNSFITKFDFLKKFPKLKTLDIWHSHNLRDKDIANLSSVAKNIKFLNLRQCPRLTGVILISLAKCVNLNRLMIDDENLLCQKSVHDTSIYEERDKIRNSTLQYIYINSGRLTTDFIEDICYCFTGIVEFYVCPKILREAFENHRDGWDDTTVTFRSTTESNKGFSMNRDIRFVSLLRDKYERCEYSESMLEVIRKTAPQQYKDIMGEE